MKKYTVTFTEAQLLTVAQVVNSHILDMLLFDPEGNQLPLDQFSATEKRVLENALSKMHKALPSWD